MTQRALLAAHPRILTARANARSRFHRICKMQELHASNDYMLEGEDGKLLDLVDHRKGTMSKAFFESDFIHVAYIRFYLVAIHR